MTQTRKVAIVTGASQGIGAALVAAFQARGYRVAANARSLPPTSDPDLLAVPGDISEPEVGRRLVEAAVDRFGRVDILVNNAGVFTSKPFTDFSAEDWRLNVGVNLTGFFFTTQAAVKAMERQGCGHVVQISTSLVDQPQAGVNALLASLTKGGLNAATRALAIEYAGRGVRANTVSLGIIDTPMHAGEDHASLAALHPLGRLGSIDEVVRAVTFLEDNPFITGEVLHLDGGQAAGRW